MRRAWPGVLDKVAEIKRVTWTYVSNAQVLDYDGRRVLLGIDNIGKARTFAQRGIHAEVVRQAFIERLGLEAVIEGVPLDDPTGGVRAGPGPAAPPPSVVVAPPPDDDAPQASPGPGRGGPSHAPGPGKPGSDTPSAGGPDWSAQAGSAPPAWATEEQAGGVPRREPPPRDDEPSHDDEDLESSGAVGQPVVESVLGGTVIRVDDELNR